MKTPVQIYDKLTTRWEEKKAEINRFPQSRVIDLLLMVAPWSALFGWTIAQHQWSVAGFSLLMQVGSHAQLQKSWRLEEQIERLERDR